MPSEIHSISEAAVALNELYVSLQDGGFTADEALKIVIGVARGQQ